MKLIQADQKFKLDSSAPMDASPQPGGNEPATATIQAADFLRDNQKLISMGRLVASIAHEINNPLESVTNLLFLISQERDLSETARSFLKVAQQELSRAVQITTQSLRFYREAPERTSIHLEDLLDEVLILYRRKIESKQLRVRREYKGSPPVIVLPGEMRQVLSNIIVNAIEASPHGGLLWLRVSSSKHADAREDGVRVTIADNGTGIDPAIRQNLGKLFFTTKGSAGTGLGLWVTMSILERVGSTLHIYSSTSPERHGTIFSIFVPTNLRSNLIEIDSAHSSEGAA